MKRTLLFIILAFFAVSCGGGGGGGPTAPSGALVGNFVLQEISGTVDGQPVRLTPPAASGNMNFTPDGRFSSNLSVPQLGQDNSWTGSCTVDGTVLTLNYDNDTIEVWTLSADQNQISGTYTEQGVTATIIFTRGTASQVVAAPQTPASTASQGNWLSLGQAALRAARGGN
jgi:hypothetical protein